MPETPKGPKRPAKNTRAAQEAAKAIGKAKVASKAAKALTPAKKPVGAPTTYNKHIASVICTRIAEGESLREIVKSVGMPDRSAVYDWLLRHPEFADQYTRAREEQADTLADEIIAIADESPATVEVRDKEGNVLDVKIDSGYVNYQRQRIDARKWTAMKLKPKKYGDKLALGGDADAPPIKTEETSSGRLFEIIRNLEMSKRAG
jgi:hypothetical protein